jgi:hypothetical protein
MGSRVAYYTPARVGVGTEPAHPTIETGYSVGSTTNPVGFSPTEPPAVRGTPMGAVVRNAEVFRVGTGTSSPPAWVATVRQPALEQQRLPRLQRLKQGDSPVTLTLTTSKEARAIWTGHGLMGERNLGYRLPLEYEKHDTSRVVLSIPWDINLWTLRLAGLVLELTLPPPSTMLATLRGNTPYVSN